MSKLGKSRIAAIAKISALALCFALVFAMTMLLTVGNSSILSPGVASAWTEGSQQNAYTDAGSYDQKQAGFWNANAIEGDSGNITPDQFGSNSTTNNGTGFPGTDSTTHWYYKETFTQTIPSTSNQSIARGASANGNAYLRGQIGGYDYWGVGFQQITREEWASWAMTYKLPTFIQKIINTNIYTVKMHFQFSHVDILTYTRWYLFVGNTTRASYGSFSMWAGSSSKQVEAIDLLNDYNNKFNEGNNLSLDGKDNDGDGEDDIEGGYNGQNFSSNVVTLKPNDTVFNLGFLGTTWKSTAESGDGVLKYAKFYGLSVYFDIQLNTRTYDSSTDVDDGAAPVVASAMSITKAQESYDPNRDEVGTTEAQGNLDSWPVWHPSLANVLGNAKDDVKFGDGNLTSYTNSQKTDSGISYYKKIVLSYYDLYDYSYKVGAEAFGPNLADVDADRKKTAGSGGFHVTGHWSWGDLNVNCDDYAAGIKTIQVGDDEYECFGSGLADQNKTIKVDGKNVGTAHFVKESNARWTVTYYLTENTNLTVIVSDYGGKACQHSVNVGGIDKTAPSNDWSVTNNDPNYINADGSNLTWYRSNQFNGQMSITAKEDTSDLGFAPYVWYVSVAKGATLAGLKGEDRKYADLAAIQSAKAAPLGVWVDDTGNFTGFTYDFEAGTIIGTGDVSGFTFQSISTNCTGAGYYRFTLYCFDLASNKGAFKDFYVRVDYEVPEFELTIHFDGVDEEGEKTDNIITYAQNGMWANDKTSVQIKLTNKLNMSGNTIVLEDRSGTDKPQRFLYFTFDDSGKLSIIASNDATYTNDASTGRLYVVSEVDGAYFTITYDSDSGIITMTLDDHAANAAEGSKVFANFVLQTTFTVYAGSVTSDTFDEATGAPIEATNVSYSTDSVTATAWAGGVKIYSDRNKPNTPNFAGPENTNYWVNGTNGYNSNVAMDNRYWYDSYTMSGVTVTFEDELAEKLIFNNYLYNNKDISLYYAIRNITNQTEMEALKGIGMEDNHGKVIESSATLGEYTFNSVQALNYLTLRNNTYTYGGSNSPFNLTDTGVGMRVIFVWTVDQAGNVSEGVNAYYVLVDSNTYSVTASVKENANFANNTNATISGGGSVKRGDKVTFTITFPYMNTVPYKFTRQGDPDVTLLENFTASKVWSLAKGAEAYADYLTFESTHVEGAMTITYTLDDPVIGAMDESLTFLFESRHVVGIPLILQFPYSYSANPLVLQYSTGITDETEDLAIQNALRFAYKQGDKFLLADGSTADAITDDSELLVPTNVGNYDLYVFIPKDNDSFVMSNFQMEEGSDTQQKYFAPYAIDHQQVQITPGNLTVNAKAGTSVYGEYFTLSYDVAGLQFPAGMSEDNPEDVAKVLEAEGITIELTLGDIDNWDDIVAGKAFAPANTYNITYVTLSVKEGGNYNAAVLFETAPYIVTKRDITIKAVDDTKVYGANDPDFRFTLAESELKWLTDQGDKIDHDTLSMDKVVNAIFGYEFSTHESGVYTFYSHSAIKRAEGEDVFDSYAFLSDTTSFTVNSSYNLTLDVTEKKFSITQRTIYLDLSGNERRITSEQAKNMDALIREATVHWSVPTEDSFLDVDGRITNALNTLGFSFGSPQTITEPDNPDYEIVYKYPIKLGGSTGEASTQNFIFKLGDDAFYIFDVLGGSAIIISLKNGESFRYVYGWPWNSANFTYEAIKDKLDVHSEEPLEFTDITWSASIEDQTDGKYLNVGSYFVNIDIDSIHIYNNGEEITGRYIAVDSMQLTISPAQIEIAPTYETLTKVYGQGDDVYGIGFKITKINGTEIAEGGTYGEYTYAQLLASVNASFMRGLYGKEGNFRRLGTADDTVTDEHGVLINPDIEGCYYAFRLNGNATLSGVSSTYSNNFVESVTANVDGSLRFVITRKEITLKVSSFVGVSRPFDGTTTVVWGNTLAYNLLADGQLVLSDTNNDVRLKFDSEYTGIGAANILSPVGIKFSNIELEGDRAFNYVLKSITLDVHDEDSSITQKAALYYGIDGSISADRGDTKEFEGNMIIVEVYYENNTTLTPHITIQPGSIGLYKSDVTITKVYDHSTLIDIDNISILSRPGTGGTESLVAALNEGKAYIVGEAHTGGYNVGTYYITITLRILVESASGYDVSNGTEGGIIDNDVRINKNDSAYPEEEGFTITITNIAVSITQLQLTGKDFASVDAVDRDYNGRPEVEVRFTYAPSALPADDTVQSVGLTLQGKAVTEAGEDEKNAGTHHVHFESFSFEDSRNYTLDLANFNETFTTGEEPVDVVIDRAKLLPNVTFEDKVYDSTTDVNAIAREGSVLTTLNYADMLADELSGFEITAPTYALSAYGAEDPNVALDEDGNVVAHNVMVRGLVITGDEDVLKNYVIYGSRFSGRGYIDTADDIKSGEPIDDYEILSAVTVSKKQIAIVQNNVTIPDKVYDGTDTATVTIGLSEGDIAVNDVDDGFSITATAKFLRHNVGANIAISLSDIALQCNESGSAKLANYELLPYTVRHYGNILARPVAMSADLGTKIYDGSAEIRSSQITYGADAGDFISIDSGSYAVQIRSGAYFVDKNVVLARDEGDNVIVDESGKAQAAEKDGVIYAPTLRNTSTGIVNYILTYSRTVGEAGGKLYAYLLADGTLVVSNVVREGDDNITKYYYELPIADRYISKDAYAAISDAAVSDEAAQRKLDALHSGIVGYIEQEGIEGYAIDSAADMSALTADEVTSLPYSVTYFRSKGKIEQKQVYILSTAVYKKTGAGSNAFDKLYDGTNKFFGESGVDFDFRKNGISGVVTGDEVKIKNVSAVYGGADTSTSYVQFNLSEIEGRDADNYFWTEELVTATLSARIRKRPIYAALNDREIVYGTVLNSLVTEIGKDIQFFLDDKFTYDGKAFTGDSMLTYDNGSFYIGFDKYVELMGLTGVEEKYIEQLWAMSFNYEDGQFVAAAEGTKGSYIRLGGSFDTLPSASLKFNTTRPNAGETSSEYTLSGGYATNFDFDKNFRYTDGAENKTSKVTVTRMDLYVASSATTHSVIYGGEYPVNDIVTFYDANGNISTFAPWDSYTALFVKGGVDIGPIIKWVDSEGHEMVKYPDITKTYYAVIVGQAGYNYKDELPNYNLYFGSFKYDEGSASITFKESDLTLTTATLNISLPSADMFNISVVASNASFVFNGTDQTRNVLGGLNDSDMVYFEGDEAHVAKEYVYGGHVGRLVVRRFIKIDKKDERGYYVEWTSSDVITINITKASPQLTARNASVSYNGRERTYPLTGGSYVQLLNVIEGYGIELTSAMIESTITKLMPDGSYEPATLRDAGTYLISISLTPAFEESYPNFAAESVTANITITKASVEITIQEGEYEMSVISGGTSGIVKLASVYRADKQYTVDYTIRMVDTALAAGPYAITSDMLEINFFRENVATETDITGAGKYSFRIVPKDESINNNYEFIGADGILELTATTLVDVDDEGTVKNSLVFEEGSTVIANELIVHRVEKVSGSGEDLALYHSIEQYMPHIDSQASIAAVLKVSLKYDNVIVTDTNGASMTLSIKLPDNVKTDMSNTAVYVSTPEGGLKKLMPAGSTEAAEAGAAAEYGTYEFKDGVLTFTTDFLGAIVFVDVAPAPFPQWLLWTLVALGALVVVFLVWLIVTLTVRKIKLYHIDRIF